MFRFITIINLEGFEAINFTRLRIYDLFLLFPHLVNDIAFPRAQGVAAVKKKASEFQEPYESFPKETAIKSPL